MCMSVRNGGRPLLATTMTLSLALMLAGFVAGFQTNLAAGAEPLQVLPAGRSHTWLSAPGQILLVNVPALCLVFSGVITGALTTLIAWPLTVVYIGATMRIGQEQLGVPEVVSSIWLYAPVEFLALLLAAGAGLMPIAAAVRSTLVNHEPITPYHQYVRVIPFALKTFGIASILLAVAAVLEATVPAFKGFV
jgi:uncharacterized membrane protein SpoIIM required for sporulation